MKKIMLLASCLSHLFVPQELPAHCQMPCGIYHDDMIFDQIDQYVETMYKGIAVMNNNKFSNPKERNEFIRWVYEKEQASDEVAQLLNSYFLQQKIKAGEPDTDKRLVAVHNLLTRCVSIKQNADLKFVEEFSDEWEKFKLYFHRKGYECDMEKIRLQKENAKRAAAGLPPLSDDHDHDHDHPHDHSSDTAKTKTK